MDFKNIPKKYRPIPFWSWNEKLDTEETKEQVRIMDKTGIGGFFMHARGGLQTEYMQDEWFSNVDAAVDEAKKLGMRPWAYDENGWPSGFGNGAVNGLGVKYQQKYLRMSESEPTENVIAKCGEHWFYYEINPFYVDTLVKEVIAEFIRSTYQPYYEKYGNEIEGFFTDKPQVSRNGIPWSFTFDTEYKSRYGEDITDILESLFLPVGDYKGARVRFWKMVTDLFSESFYKQIYDWCEAHSLKLTGHLVCEDEFPLQLISNGVCMPHYEYFHIPGMDWLGRSIPTTLTPLQLGSAAAQLGKRYVLSETFALCGHNVSFGELKAIFEYQMAYGINLLCQHLEGYSIRGMRKRDYPPAMYNQQPWWNEYDKFVEAMSREGMVLAEGDVKANVLLLHPMTTAWTLFDATDETPEKFEIAVNGTPINKTVTGYFRDKSFKTFDISEYIKEGENTISFDCNFAQSETTYKNIRNGFIFESEKNKLSYEMEIEAIYLVGNFSVKTSGDWTKLDKNAVRYSGTFEIDAPKTEISVKNIEQHGFPFFSDELVLDGIIDIPDSNSVLELDIKSINAVRVKIGDIQKVMLTDNRLDLAQFGVTGVTPIQITLINNLRNLLGPHHLKCGETYWTAPTSFFKEPCVWNFEPEKDWDDDYCFVETGI